MTSSSRVSDGVEDPYRIVCDDGRDGVDDSGVPLSAGIAATA